MSMALAIAMPGSLEGCAAALGKLCRGGRAGVRALKKLMRPRKPRKGEPPGLYWYDGADLPELLERLYRYVKQDVALAREIFCRVPQLVPAETAVGSTMPSSTSVVLRRRRARLGRPAHCPEGQAAINAELPART